MASIRSTAKILNKMNDLIYTHIFKGEQTFSLVQGDLTQEPVDAIVNAANEQLMHGGGVAALIVRAGGRAIQEESLAWVKQYGPVSHKKPAYTNAGDMPAKFIIHAVGPVWGSGDEDNKLRSAVTGSLARADQLEIESISFPAISTGIFGFPKEQAAQVIFQAVQDYINEHTHTGLKEIRMCVYDQPTTDTFTKVWETFYKS